MMKKILVMISMFSVLASLVIASNVSDNNSVEDVVIEEDVNDTLMEVSEELEEDVSDSPVKDDLNCRDVSLELMGSLWNQSGSDIFYNTGNVGIGITNPFRKLHINDAMRLEPLSSPPENPSVGDLYVHDSKTLCVYLDDWEIVAGRGGCRTLLSELLSEEAKLTASDTAGGDYFGNSVSISGDYAIVGAPYKGSWDVGSAYIFKRDGTSWSEEAKLTASDEPVEWSSDMFGRSVSIDGDYAIVGAHGDDSYKGSAYIFKRDGTSWSEEAKLTASDGAAGDLFGISVSIDGDYVIVGASSSYKDKGSAYIFKRDGTSWSEEAKILASDRAKNDLFGWSVSIDGDYAVVGAPYKNKDGELSVGSAYIFKRDGTDWLEQAKLTMSDKEEFDKFGISVSIDGDYAIVGAPYKGSLDVGSAYIFKRDGTSWSEEAKILASDRAKDDGFGASVSIDGDYAVVGADGDDDDGENSGSAYIFKRDGTSWSEEAKIIASDGLKWDGFGRSVSIDGDYVVVGAPDGYNSGRRSGLAYIFELS